MLKLPQFCKLCNRTGLDQTGFQLSLDSRTFRDEPNTNDYQMNKITTVSTATDGQCSCFVVVEKDQITPDGTFLPRHSCLKKPWRKHWLGWRNQNKF